MEFAAEKIRFAYHESGKQMKEMATRKMSEYFEKKEKYNYLYISELDIHLKITFWNLSLQLRKWGIGE